MGLRTLEEWRLRQIKKSEADENFADKCEKKAFLDFEQQKNVKLKFLVLL